MSTLPRRDSLPVWPGPSVPYSQPTWGPPPFQGAPPPMPAGYSGMNAQQWNSGQWMPNPQYDPRQYPQPQNAWQPGFGWQAPNMPRWPGGPAAPQQQRAFPPNYNPYKRQVKPPSEEYMSQPITNNGLQLDSLVEVYVKAPSISFRMCTNVLVFLLSPNRYGDETPEAAPHTPWIWNPVTLSNDGVSPARQRQNSGGDSSGTDDSSSTVTSPPKYRSPSPERKPTPHDQHPPSRHLSEPLFDSHAARPSLAAPLARHATEPEPWTTKQDLRPTFSPKLVRIPKSLAQPLNGQDSSSSLRSAYAQGDSGGRPGSIDVLSDKMNRTRFDSFSSGSSGSSASGLFSSPATTASFSSYGSGSGSFSGVSPTKNSYAHHGHSESRSIAGLAALSDEPEPFQDSSPVDHFPPDSKKHKHQRHDPSPLRREATEIIHPSGNPSSLSSISESPDQPFNDHRRRRSSRKGSEEPQPLPQSAGYQYPNSGRRTPASRTITPPSPQETPRPHEEYAPTSSRSRSGSFQQQDFGYHSQAFGASRQNPVSYQSKYSPPDAPPHSTEQVSYDTPSRRPSSSSIYSSSSRHVERHSPSEAPRSNVHDVRYDNPSRKSSMAPRYSPPQSAASMSSFRQPPSRQRSTEAEGYQHPITPPEYGEHQLPGVHTTPERVPSSHSHGRGYHPPPEPPRYHGTPPQEPQYQQDVGFELGSAPRSRGQSISSGHVYPTPNDTNPGKTTLPSTPRRTSPSWAPPSVPHTPASAPVVQQPTPQHTPMSFNPHAHLQMPQSPSRGSRTPVPVEQPPIPLPPYKHMPMPLPPGVKTMMQNFRAGYWNKRGDHLTATGYVVYAPEGMQYPDGLKTYPDVGEGYKNEKGYIIHHEDRPVLADSVSRNGARPVTPYSEVILHLPMINLQILINFF
jgi:hypothetical protein